MRRLTKLPLSDHYEAGGINVNIPIFNGFLFSARHQEANLRAQAANQAQRDLADRISRDVRVAWLNAVTAYQQPRRHRPVAEAGRTWRSTFRRAATSLDLSSIVELSQAQLNLTQAQIDNTNAKYDFAVQQAIVAYQTGQLR